MVDSTANPNTLYLGIDRRSWRELAANRQEHTVEIVARWRQVPHNGKRGAGVSRLTATTRRWVAHRHVRAAIARAKRQRAAREGKRNAERREWRSGELSQRSEALEFGGLVHDGSDRFMVEAGKHCARLYHD